MLKVALSSFTCLILMQIVHFFQRDCINRWLKALHSQIKGPQPFFQSWLCTWNMDVDNPVMSDCSPPGY